MNCISPQAEGKMQIGKEISRQETYEDMLTEQDPWLER
jgi:hypothetical protein